MVVHPSCTDVVFLLSLITFYYSNELLYGLVSWDAYHPPDTSGESMENALRACCKGIKIGKILIHREGDNGQQVRPHLSLPLLPFPIVVLDSLSAETAICLVMLNS